MSVSVARQIATRGAAVLAATLVLVGVATAAVLHTSRVRALDDALLAAAHGRAHPDVSANVEIEHSRSPIETWLVLGDDPRIPDELRRRVHEGSLFADVGRTRLVLLPFEVEGHEDGERGLAAAAADRITLAESSGPFALVYGLVATAAALAATAMLLQVVRAAFRPLERARDEAGRVVRLGAGARLPTDGPAEIRDLLQSMNDLLERLGRAQEAQASFTADAAHELRTPVTSMLLELDLTLKTAATIEGARAALESVREDVERLGRLVESLMALARIDAGQVERGRELVRAGELASGALAAERKTLEAARCKVGLDVQGDPELSAHRGLVELAVANLLRNAARHAPGSDVVLRTRREGEQAIFEVDDTGPGIPAAEREALFDRFARRGEARGRDGSGLGLGLAIAREVARRHGGDGTLDVAPGGGVRARLTLPCRSALS